MGTQQKAKCITLKGSAELVKKYLQYGVNSILYQRGIYPPETFEPAEQFGMFILMSTDDKIKTFLDTVLSQVEEWLLQRKVQQVTLVITNVNTKEVLEKWDFKVDYEGKAESTDGNNPSALPEVGTKDVPSTVSFLPLLDCLCSFDILTYTVPDCGIPKEWDETQPVFIANSQEVQLRSFSTSIHKMDTIYNILIRNEDDNLYDDGDYCEASCFIEVDVLSRRCIVPSHV
ncbi:Similar to mad2l1-1: Mitotic spindle assembly checkpoint protein MAD2A (Dictyostelium discoideum) [Cotesia congregata]|uniref:Similar to mad2l1-1: Mitotic spindle assembly checkpoint protein MAD2A (Dictyostelium discoideum) n=1 Tax=Cotesia congregata TaxID=51543 RepID=A0A8J2HN91_COTCN|nr:Similar to mad2l1-1: Mitotic spindle assembly checkpoint protein MAD2A (Dictyostelium discoideum) [Cotesia congregata]